MTAPIRLNERIRPATNRGCTHQVTDDYLIAGLKRSRCRQCDHVSITFTGDAPAGTLFTAPKERDD